MADGSNVIAKYSYDQLGRRTSKTVDDVNTYFAYDKNGNVIAEYVQDGNDVVWQKDYVYGALGELIYMQSPKTTASNQDAEDLVSFLDAWLCNPDCTQDNLYWDFDDNNQINFVDWAGYCDDFAEAFRDNGRYVLTDFKGSVVGMTDSNGVFIEISYNAWGTPSYTGDLEGLNVLWNGYYYDAETENYYLRNRYYSPLERRFVTQDPRGINPDENWNNPFDVISQYRDGFGLQVYVTGDPINNTDPWGLDTPGCSMPGGSWGNKCWGRCCANHDRCYFLNDCKASSWGDPNASPACKACNAAIWNCFKAGAICPWCKETEDQKKHRYYGECFGGNGEHGYGRKKGPGGTVICEGTKDYK